jgi:hypothetical protein
MLIGTITIPTKKGRPMVEGLDRLIARDPGKDQHLDSMEEALMSLYDQYKEMENPEEDPLKIEDEKDSKEKGEDPVEVEAQEVEECVSKEVERAVIEEIKDWSMESLTVAIPLASRNKKEVVEGLTWIYSKLKSIHIPVQRLHADRAREFVSQDVKRWAQARNLHQTFTEGDSGEANGRAEREVGIIKALTRAQLLATGEDKSLWPLALRHGAELRFRQQLLRLEVPTPALHPLWHYGLCKEEEVGERRKRRSRTTGSYEKREDHGSGFINVFDLQGILCEIGGHWQLYLLHSCRCAQAQVCRRHRTSSS